MIGLLPVVGILTLLDHEIFRIVPMYWISYGTYGAACGEEHAYAAANEGMIVERIA